MDEPDIAMGDCGLLDVGSLDFDTDFCGVVPDLDFPAFQTNWDSYKGDLFDDLLAAPVDTDVKAPTAIKDHDYVSSQPKSPSSDSGHSSGSRSPFASSASEDTPPPVTDGSSDGLDDELFGALDVPEFNADGTASNSTEDSGAVPVDFAIDLDLPDVELDAEAANQDMCLFMPMPVILPFTIQQAKAMTAMATTPACPELRLTDEEKELLSREGISLPTNMPLTKSEERILRSVRRRIRNKQSARNSRKKKQDYMDNLEERVKMCNDEKKELEKKVTLLEKQNVFLMTQLRRLQNAMRIDGSKPAKTTTCVLVLVLSFALFVVPSLSPFSTPWDSAIVKSPPMAGRSRNLLEVEEADHSRLSESVWEVRAYIQDAMSRYSLRSGTWLASLSWLSSPELEKSDGDLLSTLKANQSEHAADDSLQLGMTDAAAAAAVPRSIIVAGAASDMSDIRHDDM